MQYKHLLENDIDPNTEFGENVRLGFGVIIEANCKIGDNTFISHYSILRPNVVIGRNCKIGYFVAFEGDNIIGDGVSIHPHIILSSGTVIEDEVFIAGHTITMNDANMSYLRNDKWVRNAPVIRRRARISGACKILPGVIIGCNAVIGTGSVVTKNVPDNETWYGVPARRIR